MFDTTNIRPRLAASMTALLLIVPSVLSAQMAAPVDVGSDQASVAHQKADALVATSQTAAWSKAAKLYEEAAQARTADDEAAVGEHVIAAELFYVTGSLGRAQSNLSVAAQQAVASGRVFEAAKIMLKAATGAQQRGQAADAIAFARSAERLGRSPHLSAVETAQIRNAIVWLPVETQVAGS